MKYNTDSPRGKAWAAVQCLLAVFVTALAAFPLYWMAVSALKSPQELLLARPTLWVRSPRWENFREALEMVPLVRYIGNTLIMTAGQMVFQVLTTILAAYGFSKGRFAGKNILFLYVLGAMMIPIQVTFLPAYLIVSKLNWLNTFAGLIIPEMCSAYCIFMLRQSFLVVDDCYLEAAQIEGMGKLRLVFRVLVPLCKPTVVTITLITFIEGWNSYFWPKMITTNQTHRTIALGIVELRQSVSAMDVVNFNHIMAGAIISILPILLLFFFLQKYIVSGLSKAAMK